MTFPLSKKQQPWLAALVILLVTVAAYWPAIRYGGFIWDDNALLTDSTAIKTNSGLYTIWFTTKLPDYLPIMSTSLWIEWRLWGMNPTGYHVINVLLHALGAVLVWRVLKRLQIPGAWIAGLLFALHPVCVASTAWISERKNTLSMVFYLLSILWFLRFDEEATRPKAKGARKWFWYSLAAFVLALLSKSSVTVLPAVLLLCVWWRRERITRKDIVRTLPFFAASAACAVTAIVIQHRGLVSHDSLVVRLLGGTRAFWFYLGKTIFPLGLTMIYPLWPEPFGSWTTYVPLVAIVVGFFVAWHFRFGRGRAVLFALAYFVIALSPVLGVFNTAYFLISRVSDHLQYLAVPGIVALVAAAGAVLIGNKRETAWYTVAGVIAAAFFALTWQHSKVFARPETLWADNVKKNPDAWRVRNSYGAALFNNGHLEEAIAEYKAGLATAPDEGDLHYNLGNVYYKQQKREEAIAEFSKAAKLCVERSNAENNLGIVLSEVGRYNEAIPHFRAAIKVKPGWAQAYCNLGDALFKTDQVTDAIATFQDAINVDPSDSKSHNGLGAAFEKNGELERARDEFQLAVKLDPNDKMARQNLALILNKKSRVTESAGNLDEAITELQTAVQLNPTSASLHNSLGAAFDKKGKYDDALAQFDEAIRLDSTNVTALKNRGLVLSRKGRGAEAIVALENALKVKPDDADLHNEIGNALGRAGRIDEALPHFQKAVQLDPTIAAAQNGLGATLEEKGRIDEAVAHLQEAIRLKPDFARAHFNLGMAFLRKNRRDDAITHLKEALRLQPNYADAKRQLDALQTNQAQR